MGRKKLTGQQRQDMESMSARLKKALPASERGFAAGIASGLVRSASPHVSDEVLDAILASKCGAAVTPALRDTVVELLLEPVEDEGADGGEGAEGVDGTEGRVYAIRSRSAAAKAPKAGGDEDAEGAGDAADAGLEADGGGSSADAPSPGKGRRHRKDPKPSLREIPYVRRGDEADAEARQKIIALDQRLWVNGWLLSHPGAYVRYERELEAISSALAEGALPKDITRRQLAYRLGGDEKFFEYGSDGYKLLRAVGMEDIARHRHLPKPGLLYFAPRRRKRMRVLVTENLDPYLDVHDAMYEDGVSLFLGERIHAVVLGAGSPVLERKRIAPLLATLGADAVEVLYWGDLDRAGIDLFLRLRQLLAGEYEVVPFAPAYRLMVEKAMERYPDPTDNERTGQGRVEIGDLEPLIGCFTEGQAAYVQVLLEECRLVPQEILTKHDLLGENPSKSEG